jgi:hypothetical protein
VYSATLVFRGYGWTAGDGSYTVTGLEAGTDYQVCFLGAGGTGGSSDAWSYVSQCWQNQPYGDWTPITVTSGATSGGISAALSATGALSGTVTDAAGTHHGLAGVEVKVSVPSCSYSCVHVATTAADGSYSMRWLAPGSDYTVCFSAPRASGGSSDATGYVDQCWQNQPTPGTRTPITLTSGTTTTGINAALTAAATISGKVTDAGGTFQGLANVWVTVTSSGGSTRFLTGASGTYVIRGLPSGSDYTVCFFASQATGGSSDATGYVDQCWQNQPTSGTPTPVTLTLGATTTGIDAAVVGVG